MTDEEIDKLEAGPEIDALVAENVMEYIAWPHGQKTLWQRNCGGPYGQTFSFIPSNFISDAWQVVEKMSAQDFECQVSVTSKLPNDDKERCYCHFERGDDNAPWRPDYKLIQAWALTVPLAICRAALKAVNK